MATGNECRIQSNSTIADLFNQYFALVFTPNIEMLQEDVEQQPITDPLLTDLTISTSEVIKILHSLDMNKATGPDKIPARILKETAEEIATSLLELYNKSLWLGTLPEEWKLANVVPVYKKETKQRTRGKLLSYFSATYSVESYGKVHLQRY